MYDIIVVDDERDIRGLLSGILEDEGYSVRSAAHSEGFFELLKQRVPSLILLDIWLKRSDMDGMEILLKLQKTHPDIPVIMISGHGTVETAVRAMQYGAHNFLEKPIKIDHLLLLVSRALESAKIKQEHQEFIQKNRQEEPIELFGNSPAIQNTKNLALKHAPSNSRILVTGENGIGKKLLAKLIHGHSLRAKSPFVTISCKNKAQDVIEAELFGTHLINDPHMPEIVGALEKSHNGTLFIEGIEVLPKETQQKLTKFLVEKQYARVASNEKTVTADVRIIAATHIPPEDAVQQGLLTNDLFQRLNVVRICMPSLRDRREDIADILKNVTREIAQLHGFHEPSYSEDALVALQIFDWPGNIRQLRNIVENIVIMAQEKQDVPVSVSDLPHQVRETVQPISSQAGNVNYVNLSLRDAREVFEREYLIAQLSRFKSNISKTAQFVGMERSALHRKLRGLGISGKVPAQEESENA